MRVICFIMTAISGSLGSMPPPFLPPMEPVPDQPSNIASVNFAPTVFVGQITTLSVGVENSAPQDKVSVFAFDDWQNTMPSRRFVLQINQYNNNNNQIQTFTQDETTKLYYMFDGEFIKKVAYERINLQFTMGDQGISSQSIWIVVVLNTPRGILINTRECMVQPAVIPVNLTPLEVNTEDFRHQDFYTVNAYLQIPLQWQTDAVNFNLYFEQMLGLDYAYANSSKHSMNPTSVKNHGMYQMFQFDRVVFTAVIDVNVTYRVKEKNEEKKAVVLVSYRFTANNQSYNNEMVISHRPTMQGHSAEKELVFPYAVETTVLIRKEELILCNVVKERNTKHCNVLHTDTGEVRRIENPIVFILGYNALTDTVYGSDQNERILLYKPYDKFRYMTRTKLESERTEINFTLAQNFSWSQPELFSSNAEFHMNGRTYEVTGDGVYNKTGLHYVLMFIPRK